jgi:CheY-like chemotaxis protein
MKKYTIILVENDEDEILFMRQGFETSGLFEVLAVAEDGTHLLEWLETNAPILPDVILSDLNMPGRNGYDILKDIKGHPVYSQIPVVITSTSTATMVINKCLDLGAADYMIKPDTFIEYVNFARIFHERLATKA